MALVVILPIGALMVAVLRSNTNLATKQPLPEQRLFWRDEANTNTRVSLRDIQDLASSNSEYSARTTQEDYELMMWEMLVQLQATYNSDMWREIDSSNAVDFVNCQSEELQHVEQEYIDSIQDSLVVRNDGENKSYTEARGYNKDGTEQHAFDLNTGKRKSGIFFWHYHPLIGTPNTSHAHSWFGAAI
jgi:hypothetical protein